MPVKRKLNKKRTKVPRNVKINSKRSSQKKKTTRRKRGRSGRKSQRGGCEKWTSKELEQIFSNKNENVNKNVENVNNLARTYNPDHPYEENLEIQTQIETELEKIYKESQNLHQK